MSNGGNTLHLDAGRLQICRLGQMGFSIKCGDTLVYIDPFLSEHPRRAFPPVILPESVKHASLVCGTHDHKDHIDRAVWLQLAEASPAAKFVVPEFVLRKGLAADLDIPSSRFFGLNDGVTIDFNGIKLSAIASAHEFLDYDEASGLYPYLGYLIEVNGFVIYHAGDTCNYDGLALKLKKRAIDVMFLPINGRDAIRYSRGCIGNMTYQEAVDLAGTVRPGVVIPGHYDMFPHNSEDPNKFVQYLKVKYPEQKSEILSLGKWYIFQGKDDQLARAGVEL